MSIGVKSLFILAIAAACSASVRIRNGAYRNLVIDIQHDVPADDCLNFLLSLESALKSSSEYLHSALDGRIYYASFDIILPSTWSNDCVTNASVTNYNGAPSDVTITDTNHIFGDDLWTQQSSGCGEMGDQIYSGYKSFTDDDNVAEKFVTEWMKYRYGVFDSNGFENDSIYPPCGSKDAERFQICIDASNVEQQAPSQDSPFAKHNRYFPSKQNFLCHRQNPIDIIMRHADFNGTERNQMMIPPTFNYVKKAMTRYMVIIDDHIDINVRDSFQFLRDAIRKWMEKDLSHRQTEIGIWLMGNGTKSNDVERKLIKSLYGSDDREEIFSTLPWYIDNSNMVPWIHRSGPNCMVNHAVTRGIHLMEERAKTHGGANSVVLIIAPGWFKCPDDVTAKLIDTANDADVKITTINYPNIGPNRIEMDELALKTGGNAFTIIEKKQNEQRSLLTTFFELTNTLMYINSLYTSDSSSLPVEIYRKELVDSLENRPTFDSFNVDEATEYINFFIYIYNRQERNIEKGMKVISPINHEFSTISDLRVEYHQLSIVGNLTGYGSWSYSMKRWANPQPHFVQVVAYAKPDNQNFIKAKAWSTRPKSGGPIIVFTQVTQGSLPIIDAFVEMTVTLPNGRSVKLQLFDNGSGDPDITRGDGIYSRFFSADDPGLYKFSIQATDNGNTAYTHSKQDDKVYSCCGSVVPTLAKQTVTPFQRFLIPISTFVSAEQIAQEKTVLPFAGRIGDLHLMPHSHNGSSDNAKVTLEWSGPDVGSDNVKVDYEIRYATHLKDILDNFETLANKWNFVDTIPLIPGQLASVTINLSHEPSLIGQPFYIAIKSIVEGGFTGPVSNPVRVFVPKKRATPSPNYTVHSHDQDYEIDPSMEPSYDGENGIFRTTNRLAGISLEILIPIILCLLAAIIIISIYCWCCISRRRNFDHSSKKPVKSPSKQQPSISVIVPQSSPTYSPPMNQNQYHIDPLNGSVHSYLVDVPDHHTIGLPIDDDMIKPDFKDHDKMLFDEMKQQRQFQQQAMMDTYGQSILASANGTLTRNGRYLSPFESWTASQLLHEHERRHESPIESDPSILYVDANGEIVPPIPPHPYQNNYGYAPGDVSRMPPPHYTSVYRPLVRSPPDQGGSMQSVVSGAMMNGDKKIRNVTMV